MFEVPPLDGRTELTADMLNTVLDYVRRQGRLVPSPEVAVDQTGEGWLVRLADPMGFWARLTTGGGSGLAWEEAELRPDGAFAPHPAPRRAGPGPTGAFEANNLDCPADTHVWLTPEPTAGGLVTHTFSAPVYRAEPATAFWAEVGSAVDGFYPYEERTLTATGFVRTPLGRRAGATAPDAAVELNGQLGVPAGSVVLMLDPAARPGGGGGRPTPVCFRYGTAAGTWARLTGRTVNAAFAVSTGGATGGTFTLAVSDPTSGATHTTGVIPYDAADTQVRETLEAVVGAMAVRVTADDDGGGYAVEFQGDWGGTRNPGLTLGGDALTGTTATPTCTRTATGRDDPYTDGAGAYGWQEVAFDDEGNPYHTPGGGSSDWPYGAAHEAGGETRVPAGTVVRLRPGPTVTLAGSSGTTSDRRYLFRYGGAVGRWAILGTAARWVIDLGRPVAGLWVLRWDDLGKNPDAVVTSTRVVVACGAAATAVRVNWTQVVPTRSGGVTTDVVTAGPVVPLPATAAAVRLALETAYPILAGNLTVTGGPLGTQTTAVTPAATACAAATAVVTPVPLTIEVSGALAGCGGVAGFTFTGFTAPPGTPLSATATAGGGRARLLRYDATAAPDGFGGGVADALVGFTTADWGVVEARPLGYGLTRVSETPFEVVAAGYDGSAGLPAVSLASFLTYDGAAAAATVTAAQPVPADAATARPGRGVYHATLLTASGRSFVPARTDARVTTVAAVEAAGRLDAAVRTVVRVWTSGLDDRRPVSGEPVPERWVFSAPPAGFWASVRAHAGGGSYRIAPTLTAYSRLRYGAAAEAAGRTDVPVGSVVWAEPSAGGAGLRFSYRATPAETTALVVYKGLGGVAGTPAANALAYPAAGVLTGFVDAVPCTAVATEGFGSAVGYSAPGRYAGTSGGLPVYTLGRSLRPAAAGASGVPADGPQTFGAGSKAVASGRVAWGIAETAGGSGGSAWVGTLASPGELFTGIRSGGFRWGFRIAGDAGGPIAFADGGTPGVFAAPAAPADTALELTAGGDPDAAVAALTGGYLVAWPGSGLSGLTPAATAELMRVEAVCRVPATSTLRLTVGRGSAGGAGAGTYAAGDGWSLVARYPASVARPRASFYTDLSGFTADGVAGGTGTLRVVGQHADFDRTVTFAGGVQVSSTAGSHATPVAGGTLVSPDCTKAVVVEKGLVRRLTNVC